MKHILIGALFSLFLASCSDATTDKPKIAEAPDGMPTPAGTPGAYEFADAEYSEFANKNLAALESKDVDGYMSTFADNAILKWNSGDSIAGKVAITAFFKQLIEVDLDSVRFSNPIYLPVKVNQGFAPPGNYLLSWHDMATTFKGGIKSVQQIHLVTHYDATDKIDYMSQFIDQSRFPSPKN